MRINQYLSRYGVCSRRQADRLIAAGRIEVNGVAAKLGMQVAQGDKILIDRKPVATKAPEPWFVLYHKPRGVVCSKAETVEDNLTQALLKAGLTLPSHWFALGRLDKDSEGLLLLSNQGQFADGLLKHKARQGKTYLVTLDKQMTAEQVQQLADGIMLGDQKTLPCQVSVLAPNIIQMVLQQGLHRQIRRMCQKLGLCVMRLQRVDFAGLPLTGLGAGQWRHLGKSETNYLYRLLQSQESTN